MENVLITDYHCASNRGDAAILEGELAVLRKQFPDADVTVMTEYPEAARLLHDVDVVPQKLPPFELLNFRKNAGTAFTLLDAAVRGKTGLSLPFSGTVVDRLELEPYLNADLVVSTGGIHITEAYYPAKLGVFAEWYLAKFLSKPVVVYAQSLGPFPDDLEAITRSALDIPEVIITRDSRSERYIDDLEVDTPIHVGVDAAWSMPLDVDPRPIQQQFRTDPSLPDHEGGPLISVSTRRWSHFETEEGEEQYFRAVAEAVTELIESRNAEVVFLSTCTGLAGYHTDDRVAASHVMEYIDDPHQRHASIVSDELTPQQLVALYEDVDLHVGTRMHSCILSLLARTPCVPIEYQFKTSGMMSQFGLEEYVLNIDGLRSRDLTDTINDVFESSDAIRTRIDDRLPEIREAARENGAIAQEYATNYRP